MIRNPNWWAVLCLVLAHLAPSAVADAFNISALPLVEIPLVRQPHFDHGMWNTFLSKNLHADLAYWRQRAPLKAEDILTALNQTLTTAYIPAVMQLVLIYNNVLYWPMRPDPNGGEPTRDWSSYFNIHLQRRLGPALASGRLQLPNVLFIYNTDDNAPRFNAPFRNLSVPLVSLIKSVGREDGDDLDILVPQMFMVQTSMYTVPWHLKQDKAFFRGIPYCAHNWVPRYGFLDACPRLFLSQLSERDLKAGNSTALDCAIVEPHAHRLYGNNTSIKMDLPVKPRVEFSVHAAYKWVLNMEGITASSRLGQLFMTNSLVLFQRSLFVEHFYRSLRPWVHYVPFWNATGPDGTPLGMDDVYGTLDDLRRLDREQPEVIQNIIATANKFALELLTHQARMRYYQAALVEYKSLFGDMDAFLEKYVADLRAKGWNIR